MKHTENILQLGGRHLKVCPYCETMFYGRKNQKYCSTSHKAQVNNEQRSKEHDQFSPWLKEMVISYKALKSCYFKRDENGWVKTSTLVANGFDPDVATKLCSPDGETTMKYLFDIAFEVSSNRQFVKLIKSKSNET